MPATDASCGCCGDSDQCPCAHQSENEKPTLPAIPVSREGINLAVSPAGPEIFEITPTQYLGVVLDPLIRSDAPNGYRGVPLSVAFCRFII
ncbi:MAG: hypothetical protein H7Y36_09565 [Armatimonadetes bacterium]|nr:hypothetical protein [Akkermansiaceae bacterium]